MKTTLKTFLFAAALFTSAAAFAKDNNLVIFSQDGNKFTVILNGLQQNEKPETNVKITGLDAPNYKVKIIFESPAFAPFDQTAYLMDGGVEVDNREFSYALEQKKNGEWKLKANSIADISTAKPDANQVVYVFNPSGNATPQTTTTTVSTTTSSGSSETININMGMPQGTTTQQTTTTTTGVTGTTQQTTTTTTTNGTPNAAGVNMNVGGVGMNVVIYDNMGGTSQQTTTTTTTQTTGTTQPAPQQNTATQCYWPMTSSEFANAKASVQKQSFEEEKLKVAKQILNTNCMSSAQVKEIMALFSYEDTKLDWAKFAYGKTTDPQNYYQLNDGFTYPDSVDALNEYIESRK